MTAKPALATRVVIAMTITSPVAVSVVAIMSAIMIAGSADGSRAKHAAEDAERSEGRSAARSAREDDGAAATPSVGNETGRAAVPLRG